MDEPLQLNHPWLVAVWPGMGHVALNAGVYLLSKLGMNAIAEFDTGDLFDVNEVEVKEGLIQPIRRPRNRFFVWQDPAGKHDLLVFLGEAQPPIGKLPFCRQVLNFAREMKTERVFTFAAMATHMRPESASRVFSAATDLEGVEELQRLDLEKVDGGTIGGLNGLLLAAAVEYGIRGSCLLGEMPQIFAQVPFPKASLAILEVFKTIAGIELDLTELAEQAHSVEEQLGELLSRVESQYAQNESDDDEGDDDEDEDDEDEDESEDVEETEGTAMETSEEQRQRRLTPVQRERLEELFRLAAENRSKAFELKQELDRLGTFKEYEDRFLDLFKKSDG